MCKMGCIRNRIMAEVEIGRLSVFNTDGMNEFEQVIEMIKELSVGVNGFNESEIADILSFISRLSVLLAGDVEVNPGSPD